MTQYKIYITPQALQEIKDMPGNFRQRARRAIEKLKREPRPSNSKELSAEEIPVELRRLRLERWRMVYLVNEQEKTIDVLAIRKRPPYDYGDLAQLLEHKG